MVYGAEAVLPSDLLHNAPQVELFSEAKVEQARQDAVDLLKEEREMALIRSTIYQQDLRRFHAPMFEAGHSRKEILYSEYVRNDLTRLLQPGRAPSSSPKYSTMEHTTPRT